MPLGLFKTRCGRQNTTLKFVSIGSNVQHTRNKATVKLLQLKLLEKVCLRWLGMSPKRRLPSPGICAGCPQNSIAPIIKQIRVCLPDLDSFYRL